MLKKKNLKWLKFLVFSIFLAILSIVVLTVFEYTAVAEVREYFTEVNEQDSLKYGKLLFETRGCAGCHSIAPNQNSLGPNLSGLGQRQSLAYIRQSIVSPGTVIVEGYEAVVMPDFGSILEKEQVEALAQYVLSIVP